MIKPTPHSPLDSRGLLRQISIALTGFAILTGGLFYATAVLSQETTESSVPDEEIKENIKDRLEKAIKEKDVKVRLKRAWVGTLQSIANHTLTIDTREGPKLASISAESTFVRLPKRAEVTAEDLEIGSYTIVMGYLDGNQVLSARRVVVQSEPPVTTKRQSHFATSLEYDSAGESITANLSSRETITLEVEEDTELSTAIDSQIKEAEIDDLRKAQRAIIIVKTEKEDEEETTTILRIHIL